MDLLCDTNLFLFIIQAKNFFRDIITSPEWMMVISTLILAMIALFGEYFKDLINKPKIVFGISGGMPHIVQAVRNSNLIWYFRLKIKNMGRTIAKNCHVKIISITDERKRLVDYFEPSTLKWSNAPRDMRYREDPTDIKKENIDKLIPIFREFKDISPNGGWEMCDLFETEGKGNITFLSSWGKSILVKEYIITIEIFGDNIKPKRKRFKISPCQEFPLVKIAYIE